MRVSTQTPPAREDAERPYRCNCFSNMHSKIMRVGIAFKQALTDVFSFILACTMSLLSLSRTCNTSSTAWLYRCCNTQCPILHEETLELPSRCKPGEGKRADVSGVCGSRRRGSIVP